jgi:hypothetical protein
MVLALAALFLQPVFPTQVSFSAEKIARLQPPDPKAASLAPPEEILLPLPQVQADVLMPPAEDSDLTAAASAPEPPPVSRPPAIPLMKPSPAMTVSVSELIAEGRSNRRLWLRLAMASHSAATFDAWSTRHAITSEAGRELDPLFKPFAGNASLYVAIQAGPLLMDYLGRKMMYNRHGWMRRIWWVPQSASIAASLLCGAHNLGIRPAAN